MLNVPRHPIYSIGHASLSEHDLIGRVKSHAIDLVVDVRLIPKSKRAPQFNETHLRASLSTVGIGYRHFPELGGRRSPLLNSLNTAWRNLSLKGYADHMQSDVFLMGIHELLEAARHQAVVIFCKEAQPWRCHRSLIADALNARGINVQHILRSREVKEHRLTTFAKVRGIRVTYPRPGATWFSFR